MLLYVGEHHYSITVVMSQRAAPPPAPKKRYDAPLRAAKAKATRERIRAAAEARFLSYGYGRTSMASIATAAGIAEKTLYLAFPNKPAVLSEVIRVAVRGDGEETPLVQRRSWQHLLRSPDDQIIRRYAAMNERILHRAGRVLALAEAVALTDAELLDPRRRGQESQRGLCEQLAVELEARDRLAPEVSTGEATDVIFGLSSEAMYLRLVADCGWSRKRYTIWLARTLDLSLTTTPGDPRTS